MRKSELPGIVALDASIAINPKNARYVSLGSDERFAHEHGRSLAGFVKRHHEKLQACVRGKGVRSIVIHDQVIVQDAETHWSLSGFTFWVPVIGLNGRAKLEASSFQNAYGEGLPSFKRLVG